MNAADFVITNTGGLEYTLDEAINIFVTNIKDRLTYSKKHCDVPGYHAFSVTSDPASILNLYAATASSIAKENEDATDVEQYDIYIKAIEKAAKEMMEVEIKNMGLCLIKYERFAWTISIKRVN